MYGTLYSPVSTLAIDSLGIIKEEYSDTRLEPATEIFLMFRLQV